VNRSLGERLCPNCENYAPKLKILVPDENLQGKWIPENNHGFTSPIRSLVKEKSGDCTIKFENGEKVKHAKLNLVPFCSLGRKGLLRSECSRFKPRSYRYEELNVLADVSVLYETFNAP
jgi:hypothetical protein